MLDWTVPTASKRTLSLVLLGALLLAGCTATPSNRQVSLPVPDGTSVDSSQPAAQREHARTLASYGGVYENARLQETIEKTVERLVAASERPDLKYRVTMLNSPAINAFAQCGFSG